MGFQPILGELCLWIYNPRWGFSAYFLWQTTGKRGQLAESTQKPIPLLKSHCSCSSAVPCTYSFSLVCSFHCGMRQNPACTWSWIFTKPFYPQPELQWVKCPWMFSCHSNPLVTWTLMMLDESASQRPVKLLKREAEAEFEAKWWLWSPLPWILCLV